MAVDQLVDLGEMARAHLDAGLLEGLALGGRGQLLAPSTPLPGGAQNSWRPGSWWRTRRMRPSRTTKAPAEMRCLMQPSARCASGLSVLT